RVRFSDGECRVQTDMNVTHGSDHPIFAERPALVVGIAEFGQNLIGMLAETRCGTADDAGRGGEFHWKSDNAERSGPRLFHVHYHVLCQDLAILEYVGHRVHWAAWDARGVQRRHPVVSRMERKPAANDGINPLAIGHSCRLRAV